jgi:hypothetical protein
MSYINIPSSEVKLCGAGARLQWGMVIGVAVDKIVGVKADVTDESMMAGIRAELANHEVRGKVTNPAHITPEAKHIVQKLLHGSGTKLTVDDLDVAFKQAGERGRG